MSGVFIFQGATNLFENLMLALDSLLREMQMLTAASVHRSPNLGACVKNSRSSASKRLP